MSSENKLKVGSRVTRPVYMDDGTWAARGDDCLPESPLLHGVVIQTKIGGGSRLPLVQVRWEENGKELWYYEHGVTLAE